MHTAGETPKILLGIATLNPDRRFLESLQPFVKEVTERKIADLHFKWVWNERLVDAQNIIADKFLSFPDFDYLLFLEDDHFDFKAEMLESCLNAANHVTAIPYRSRHFPFEMIPMRFEKIDSNGVRRFTGLNHKSGNHESDLCGFGFTLIHRSVFEILEKPYFRLNNEYYKGVGCHATDIDFCFRVQSAGLKIIGNFDYVLPHRDLNEDAYKELKVSGALVKHSMFTHIRRLVEGRKREHVLKEV